MVAKSTGTIIMVTVYVTALIGCGVCEPSNYTGFYKKCNLLRNKENRPTIYRPSTVLGHSATIL